MIPTVFSKKLEQTTQELKKMARDLEVEKAKTDNILKEMLPTSVVQSLRDGKTVEACRRDTRMLLNLTNRSG